MSTTPAVNLPPQVNPAVDGAIADVKRRHALRNCADAPSEAGSNTSYIVENLLPERQLGVIVGNSGLGKSPALYQLGICASAGLPFFQEQTVGSDVLYLDFENGASDSNLLAERIAKFLGLSAVPENFFRWNGDDCAANFGRPGHGVEDIIRDWSRATANTGRPKLAIVDPLRFWLKKMEDARHADEEIQLAKRVIRDVGVAILGVHHLRRINDKSFFNPGPSLEQDPRSWIQTMSRGATALINGSDVRLGFENAASSAFASEKEALVLAGFRRVHGQIGPIYVERVIAEEDSEPQGYRRLAAVELLGNPSHIEAFQKFPQRFTFTEAVHSFGKSDSATTNLLKKCIALKVLRKEGKRYVKTSA